MQKKIQTKSASADASITGSKTSKPCGASKPHEESKFNGKSSSSTRKPGKKKSSQYGNSDSTKTSGSQSSPFKTSEHNDVEGYTRFKDILDPATQLAFSTPFGGVYRGLKDSVPGLIVIPYLYCTGIDNPSKAEDNLQVMPDAGYHNGSTTAFNVAGRSVYTTVRASRGGSRPYLAVDMEHMLMSAMTIFATFSSLARALRLAKKYSYANVYLGATMLKALGFDRQDIIENYQNYISALNLVIRRADIIKLPKGLVALDRGNGLNSNVFKDNDADNIKQQYIAYRPYAIYQYNEANGTADPVKLNYEDGFLSVLRQLDTAITQLGNSETFQIMIGDLANVYRDDLVTISPVSAEDDLEFVWSAEAVVQIQNSKSINTILDNANIHRSLTDIDDHWDDGLPALKLNQDKRSSPEELLKNEGALFYGDPTSVQTLKPFGIVLPLRQSTVASGLFNLAGRFHNIMEDIKTYNLYDDNPSSEAVIYATRNNINTYFVVNPKGSLAYGRVSREHQVTDPDDKIYLVINGVGTEILLRYEIHYMVVRDAHGIGTDHYNGGDIISTENTLTKPSLELSLLMSNFQVAPKVLIYSGGNGGSTDDVQIKVLGDVIVPCDIDNNSWMRINAACIYSMGLIPQYSDASGSTTLVRTK